MPIVRLPLIASGFIEFVKILSIRVPELFVILVGSEIEGRRKLLVMMSRKSRTSLSESELSRL